MTKDYIKARPYDEAHARRVAWIMGENSAAAQSLAELERRRAAGENVALYRTGSSVLVVRVDAEKADAPAKDD